MNELVRTLGEFFTEAFGTVLVIGLLAAWAMWSDRRDRKRDGR